ncbi:MAG: hypothetical protein ACYDG2_14550 [Ruminiclostridium sp.]
MEQKVTKPQNAISKYKVGISHHGGESFFFRENISGSAVPDHSEQVDKIKSYCDAAHLLDCESLFKYNGGKQKSLLKALFCTRRQTRWTTKRI